MGIIDKILGRGPKSTVADVTERLVGETRPRRAEWLPGGIALPPWAKIAEQQHEKATITLDVDSAAAYAYWLELLGFTELTQYTLEVAYQCIKLDMQAALVNSEHDPRFAKRHVAFRFSRSEQYALAGKPVGKSAQVKLRDGGEKKLAGAQLATYGREARDHYVRVRGALPF